MISWILKHVPRAPQTPTDQVNTPNMSPEVGFDVVQSSGRARARTISAPTGAFHRCRRRWAPPLAFFSLPLPCLLCKNGVVRVPPFLALGFPAVVDACCWCSCSPHRPQLSGCSHASRRISATSSSVRLQTLSARRSCLRRTSVSCRLLRG